MEPLIKDLLRRGQPLYRKDSLYCPKRWQNGGPKVSVIQRFHCMHTHIHIFTIHTHTHTVEGSCPTLQSFWGVLVARTTMISWIGLRLIVFPRPIPRGPPLALRQKKLVSRYRCPSAGLGTPNRITSGIRRGCKSHDRILIT